MNIPEKMPAYTIRKLEQEPFRVRWEELMGWLIIPRLGEQITWGLYDQPEGLLTEWMEMKVTGKAAVHGIEGVEIHALDHYLKDGPEELIPHEFVAQMTETHCRYLAHGWMAGDVHSFTTFLDEEYEKNWGFGEDNCGNETDIRPKGDIVRDDHTLTLRPKENNFYLDVVGRYEVTVDGRAYDTICVMDVETYDEKVLTEQFLDKCGRTVLWRHFRGDGWHGQNWVEKMPEAERFTVLRKGEAPITYVHDYDCVSDYIG